MPKNLLIDENGEAVTRVSKHLLSERGVKRGTDEEGFTVKGGKVLVFGDLHLSAQYKGTHNDYYQSCIKVMLRILEIVEKEGDVGAVFLLGDVFGVKERNIRDFNFRLLVTSFFQQLNIRARGNVFSVRGNHDFGDSPDFYHFEQINLLKNPDYVDYYAPSGGVPEVRFHFVNYGYEDRKLDLGTDPNTGNVVLAHNDFQIPGLTAWYGGENVIELKKHTPFVGIDLVLSGHIHTPSPELLPFHIGDAAAMDGGDAAHLFYLGCPTRVSERIDDCYYAVFEVNEENANTDFNLKEFGLWPVEEEFLSAEGTVDEVLSETEVEDASTRERRTKFYEELRDNSILGGDVRSQIEAMPDTTDRIRSIALEYYDKAVAAC